jgi:hypothetical protein
MHAASILLGDLGVAGATGLRDGGTKLRGFGALDFVRCAVASGAVRCSTVALTYGLPVHTTYIFFDYATVARCARRFGNRRVRILFMLNMATLAGNRGVDVPLELIAHFTVTR